MNAHVRLSVVSVSPMPLAVIDERLSFFTTLYYLLVSTSVCPCCDNSPAYLHCQGTPRPLDSVRGEEGAVLNDGRSCKAIRLHCNVVLLLIMNINFIMLTFFSH